MKIIIMIKRYEGVRKKVQSFGKKVQIMHRKSKMFKIERQNFGQKLIISK